MERPPEPAGMAPTVESQGAAHVGMMFLGNSRARPRPEGCVPTVTQIVFPLMYREGQATVSTTFCSGRGHHSDEWFLFFRGRRLAFLALLAVSDVSGAGGSGSACVKAGRGDCGGGGVPWGGPRSPRQAQVGPGKALAHLCGVRAVFLFWGRPLPKPPPPSRHPWHDAAVTLHFACVSSPPWGSEPDPPAWASGTGVGRLGHSPCFPRGSFLVLLLRECFQDLSWLATVGSATGEAGLLVTSIVPQTPFFWAMRITEVRACLSLPGLGVRLDPSVVASRTTASHPQLGSRPSPASYLGSLGAEEQRVTPAGTGVGRCGQ